MCLLETSGTGPAVRATRPTGEVRLEVGTLVERADPRRPGQPGGTCQFTRSLLRARPMRAWPHPPNAVSSVLPA